MDDYHSVVILLNAFPLGYAEVKRKRRHQIKSRPMFCETSDKNNHRASLLEKRQKMMLPCGTNHLTTIFTKNSEDFGIRRRTSGVVCHKESSSVDKKTIFDSTIGGNLNESDVSKTSGNINKSAESEYVDLKMKKKTNNTCHTKVILDQDHKQLQQDVNPDSTIIKKSLNVPTNNHEKTSENKSNLLSSRTSSHDTNRGAEYQLTKPTISLVSENYNDTDSDSSK